MLTSIQSRWQQLTLDLPSQVNLLAVSKGHGADAIRDLVACGQLDFGESRVQEALPKQDALGDLPQIRWHFIGRLQANKVRSVVKAFSWIHSIDSLALAQRTSRIALEEQQQPTALLQVKLRDDPAKGGWEIGALKEAWPELQSLKGLRISGLMTKAPMGVTVEDRSALFKECRHLADAFGLQHCSMGMSGDWREAAAAGATWVRLGSVLFGPRQGLP